MTREYGAVGRAPSAAREMDRLLRTVNVRELIERPVEEPPHSPLYEYVLLQRTASSGPQSVSNASDDSVDSFHAGSSTHTMVSESPVISAPPPPPATPEEAEMAALIQRLCRSLYKKAVDKTKEHGHKHSRTVDVDAAHERNMSHIGDWMPLLHLFDPQEFFALRERSDQQLSSPTSEFRRDSLNVARNPKEASQLLQDTLLVEKLSGGNSNHVYRLAHPDFPEKSILLRVYGSGDSDAIDRHRDVAAMTQMAAAELSPAVLHTFRWGRVEEFMDAVATCTTDMLLASPFLLPEVYQTMFKMHQLPVTPFFPQTVHKSRMKGTVPRSFLTESYSSPEEYCEVNAKKITSALLESKRSIYYMTDTNRKVLEELCPSSFERACLRFLRITSSVIRPEYRVAMVQYVVGEVMWLRGCIQQRGIPVVFSHNDMNPGNILLSWRKVPAELRVPPPSGDTASDADEEGDEVTSVVSEQTSPFGRRYLTKKGHHKNLVDMKGLVLIDFEYSDANYRCVDLGNTICELDYDYSRGTEEGGPGFIKYLSVFPPPEQSVRWRGLPIEYPRLPELIFDRWKAEQEGQPAKEHKEGAPLPAGQLCLNAIRAYFAAVEGKAEHSVSREQLTEVLLGMLAAHIHWALWSFVLGCNSDACTNNADDDGFAKGSSGLDYIVYGDCRLKEYIALKDWMKERSFI